MTRSSTTRTWLILVPLLGAAAACSPVSTPTAAARGAWKPTGKADRDESCKGVCGGQADVGCWCDDLCAGYGDCCPDKVAVCACRPASCQPDQCGAVDDGCGGTLDCGMCAPSPSPSPVPPANPSDLDCFYDWGSVGNCPAPIITAAYLGSDCAGAPGLFVIGQHFQSPAMFDSTNHYLASGPWLLSSALNRDWRVLTPSFMCIPNSPDDPGFSASASDWSGVSIRVQNPDQQLSNTSTVQNLLYAAPPLASTGSTDPFDPAACLDPEMASGDGLAFLQPSATTSTLGAASIVSRSRACSLGSGCSAWGPASQVATNVAAGVAKKYDGAHFTMNGVDCGLLGHYSNLCPTYSPGYQIHVAAHCAQMLANRERTSPSLNAYTEAEWVWLVRY